MVISLTKILNLAKPQLQSKNKLTELCISVSKMIHFDGQAALEMCTVWLVPQGPMPGKYETTEMLCCTPLPSSSV